MKGKDKVDKGDSRHLKNNITMIPIVTKTSLD
jgi:hypothetical protein